MNENEDTRADEAQQPAEAQAGESQRTTAMQTARAALAAANGAAESASTALKVTEALDADLRALKEQIAALDDPIGHTMAQDFAADAVDDRITRAIETWVDAHGALPIRQGIRRKMHALMQEVGAIDRDHTVTGDGPKFNYRSVHDVINAVSPAMARLGIMLGMQSRLDQYRVDVVNGRSWTSAAVEVIYTFTDVDDGSTHVVSTIGESRALDDKTVSKANTMALKTMLTQVLMIRFAEADPDSTVVQIDPQEAAPARPAAPAEQPIDPVKAIAGIKWASARPTADERVRAFERVHAAIAASGIAEATVEGATVAAHYAAARRLAFPPTAPAAAEPFDGMPHPPEPPRDGGY